MGEELWGSSFGHPLHSSDFSLHKLVDRADECDTVIRLEEGGGREGRSSKPHKREGIFIDDIIELLLNLLNGWAVFRVACKHGLEQDL
jgi:hypothetical protein